MINRQNEASEAFEFPVAVWHPTANEMTIFFIDVERALLISSCVFQLLSFFLLLFVGLIHFAGPMCVRVGLRVYVWGYCDRGRPSLVLVLVLLCILAQRTTYIGGERARLYTLCVSWPWPTNLLVHLSSCVCLCMSASVFVLVCECKRFSFFLQFFFFFFWFSFAKCAARVRMRATNGRESYKINTYMAYVFSMRCQILSLKYQTAKRQTHKTESL